MNAIADAVSRATTATEAHRTVVNDAITIAQNNIAQALTKDVFLALAHLKNNTDTYGEYLQCLSDFKKTNKEITKKYIEDGVKACEKDLYVDESSDELRKGVEPWPEHVDGAAIFQDLFDVIERHCVLPDGGATATTLWVMAAYTIDSFRVFPKLLVHSPQKRCGKTTLLEVLQGVMPQALSGSNVTPSVIFRAIDLWGVSILLDEVDTFMHSSDDLRGIVNSGHTKSGAYVWRTEGDTVKEPRQFSTWAPMVLAMIGNPPSTVLDRSVKIRLTRKTASDKVERIPQSFQDDCLSLRRRLRRWADDKSDLLKSSCPSLPSHDNDRAVDNWSALFAVAELVGVNEKVKSSMEQLELSDDDVDDLSIELLRDISELIDNGKFEHKMRSTQIVNYLLEMLDRPWLECNRGRPLSANKLAFLLKPYQIKAKTRKISGKSAKSYEPLDFKDAILRYVSKPTQSSNQDSETASDQRFRFTEQFSNHSMVTEHFSNLKRLQINVSEPKLPNCTDDNESTEVFFGKEDLF